MLLKFHHMKELKNGEATAVNQQTTVSTYLGALSVMIGTIIEKIRNNMCFGVCLLV